MHPQLPHFYSPAEACRLLGLDAEPMLMALSATAAIGLFCWLIFFAFEDDDGTPPDDTGWGW